jgi:hypothetical protein
LGLGLDSDSVWPPCVSVVALKRAEVEVDVDVDAGVDGAEQLEVDAVEVIP